MKYFTRYTLPFSKVREGNYYSPNILTRATIIQIIMRIQIIIFLTLLSGLSLNAKTVLAQKKVTLNLKQQPLEKAFLEIEKATGVIFWYQADILKDSKPVTINLKEASLEEALKACFADQPYNYKFVGSTIVVSEKLSKPASKQSTVILPITIKGNITDKNANPLVGVSIRIKGTNVGTVTDQNGNYSINGDSEGIIVFSYIGFQTFEIKINGQAEINMTLVDMNTQLDQIQVIAYGTTSKRLSTGNTATITAKDIEKQPVNNPLLALQGRVPGLNIVQSTGLPGSGVTVRIQGQNSILRGNDPFYVVDGIPYLSQLLPSYQALTILGGSGKSSQIPGGQGNPLSFINPADIESITILKDADATAIYGSRAANGAILITTKKGKAGKAKVDVNMQHGFGKMTKRLELLNTEQYLEMRREAKRNNNNQAILATDYDLNGSWDQNRYTDWQEELLGGTASYSDIQANLSGGNANTQFLLGTAYHRETTVFPGNLFDRKVSARLNVNHHSSDQRFRANFTVSYMRDANHLAEQDLTRIAMQLAPNAPAVYNADGTLNWAPLANGNSTWQNPLAFQYIRYNIATGNLLGSAALNYRILTGLDIRVNLGYNELITDENRLGSSLAVAPENRAVTPRASYFNDGTSRSWNIEPQISYETRLFAGKVSLLIGAALQQSSGNQANIAASGFSNDLVLEDIKAATSLSILSSLQSRYRYNALFSRVSYNYGNKYLVNLTARRDASSRFGSDNMVHDFGAVGAAWIFSEEGLFKRTFPFLSYGKLQSSYGLTGNDQIGDYQYLNQYIPYSTQVAYQSGTSLVPDKLSNAHLQWESTTKWSSSLNLGFLKDRILVEAVYYRNRSSSQLLFQSLPYTTGFPGVIGNFPAKVQNYGWEFSLNTENVKKPNFSWSSNLNLTLPKNKLISFANLETSSYASQLLVGKPIGITKLYPYQGVNQQSGLYEVTDRNGNPTSAPNSTLDKTTFIDTFPYFLGGLLNSFQYKGFSLDFLLQFGKRNARKPFFDTFSGNPGQFYGTSNIANYSADILNRWSATGQQAQNQKIHSGFDLNIFYAHQAAFASPFAYTEAAFLRLKNIALYWTLPEMIKKKAKASNVRLYVQGQNLWTITGYDGLDPESANNISLPPLKVMTFGLQASF